MLDNGLIGDVFAERFSVHRQAADVEPVSDPREERLLLVTPAEPPDRHRGIPRAHREVRAGLVRGAASRPHLSLL